MKENVVVYLTGEKNKDNAIRKYCYKEKLNIVGEFMPKMEESEVCWNSSISDLYNGIIDLKGQYYITRVITYDLENLFWCTYDQVAIALMLFDLGPAVFTLKEGDIYDDDTIEIKLNINEDNIKHLKKYWVNEDKK